MALEHEVAPVDDELRALVDAGLDVVVHPLARLGGDQRAEVGVRVVTAADLQLSDAFGELGDERIGGLLADRHGDGDRHAALTGGAVAGADEGVRHLVHVGVGHDDRVVLGAAEALGALAVGGGGLVDVLGDRGGADEADGLDALVGEQHVDDGLVAVDDVEHAGGQPGLDEQLGQAQRHGRVALGRLEHERVSARDGRAGLPQRDHRGEVERGDAGDDAERLAHRVDVDAGAGGVGELALEQVRDAGGELDHLEAALDVALGVGDGLAVLGGQQPGQVLHVVLHELQELHQHPGALLRVERRPFLLRLDGVRDDGLGLGDVGEGNAGLHLTGVGVEDVGEPVGGAGDVLAPDEVGEFSNAHVRIRPNWSNSGVSVG